MKMLHKFGSGIICVVVILPIVYCTPWKGHVMPANEMSHESEPVSTASTYDLSDQQKNELIERAQRGDQNAAFSLYQYFSLSNYNEIEEEKWLITAAEHGHIVAQYNLAARYLERNDLDRASTWAYKAFNQGDKSAAELLDEIKKKRGK